MCLGFQDSFVGERRINMMLCINNSILEGNVAMHAILMFITVRVLYAKRACS